MKKIECVIRPEKTKDLVDALRATGIGGITLTESKGFGKETTRPESYLVLPKTKVEIYAVNEQVEEIIDTIITTCQTGSFGDGKIVVMPIDESVRIRTNERRESAIL